MAEGEKAEGGVERSGGRGMEESSEGVVEGPAVGGAGEGEGAGVMGGRFGGGGALVKGGEDGMGVDGGGDAQDLAAHLAGGEAGFFGGLGGVEEEVGVEAGGELMRGCGAPTGGGGNGVAGSKRPLEAGAEEGLKRGGIGDCAGGGERFQARRVGMGAGREKAVGELEQREESFSGHGDWDAKEEGREAGRGRTMRRGG